MFMLIVFRKAIFFLIFWAFSSKVSRRCFYEKKRLFFPPGKHSSCQGGPWLSECWDGCASACTCPFELAVLEDSLSHAAFNNTAIPIRVSPQKQNWWDTVWDRERERQVNRLTEKESFIERIGLQDNEGWVGKSKIQKAAIRTGSLESQVEPSVHGISSPGNTEFWF